jgi:hypothetical protein
VTPQEDQNCRNLIYAYCPSPGAAPQYFGGESETPFIDN